MSTFAQQAAVAADPGFLARLRAAVVLGAVEILGEPRNPAAPQTELLRQALASSVVQDPAPWLPRFAWAVATNPAVANAAGGLFSISQTSNVLPCVVGVFQTTGFAGGEIVEITGATDPAVNGTWTVTVVNPTAFSIQALGTETGGAGGTVSLQATDADITSAVSQVWNSVAGVTNQTV